MNGVAEHWVLVAEKLVLLDPPWLECVECWSGFHWYFSGHHRGIQSHERLIPESPYWWGDFRLPLLRSGAMNVILISCFIISSHSTISFSWPDYFHFISLWNIPNSPFSHTKSQDSRRRRRTHRIRPPPLQTRGQQIRTSHGLAFQALLRELPGS